MRVVCLLVGLLPNDLELITRAPWIVTGVGSKLKRDASDG